MFSEFYHCRSSVYLLLFFCSDRDVSKDILSAIVVLIDDGTINVLSLTDLWSHVVQYNVFIHASKRQVHTPDVLEQVPVG